MFSAALHKMPCKGLIESFNYMWLYFSTVYMEKRSLQWSRSVLAS